MRPSLRSDASKGSTAAPSLEAPAALSFRMHCEICAAAFLSLLWLVSAASCAVSSACSSTFAAFSLKLKCCCTTW
eukprot:8918-Heterococcus_DN1.PRE.1